MANQIKLKNSSTPSKIPLTTDLVLGEVAINTYDGKLFIKKDVTGVQSIVEVGTAQSTTLTGDVTGTGTGTVATTLANSGVTAGSYNNSATSVTPFTVDVKGRITSTGTSVTITPAFGSITGTPTTLSGYGITDAAPSSHVGSGGSAHATATTTTAGFLSAADKTKLDGISAGATNYSLPVATTTVLGGIKDGTGVTIAADGTVSVDYGSAAGTAVQGNDSRVTADQAAATASIRTLGTGAQQAAAGNHTHLYAGSASAGGAATSVASSQIIKFDTGVTEGTDIYTFNGSAAKTLDIKAGTNITLTKAAGSITINSNDTSVAWSEITSKPTTLSGYGITDAVSSSLLGANSGVATLDSTGKVPSAQLPSFVDDVLEYTNQAAFPATGSAGIIYVAQDTNKIYRWSGSAYIEISPTAGNVDTATKLATARTIALSGDVTGSASFDGSANVTIAATIATGSVALGTDTTGNYVATLAAGASGTQSGTSGLTISAAAGSATAATVALSNTGVTAGTYKSVTVDAQGRVSAGTNPTTIAGYGITDAVDTSGNQTVNGTKTFTNLVINGNLTRTGGTAPAYYMSQDGTGRQHWYWNTSGGAAPTFAVANEGATDILMHADSNGGEYFKFRAASGIGKLAGDAIVWEDVIYASRAGTFQFKGSDIITASNASTVLPNSGVTAGTYKSVTVDAKGRVTAGTNPTTLSGYGITDAAASVHTHSIQNITDSPYKDAVTVATTAALAATYANGTAGVGATLTNSGTLAALSIDGVALAANDRVLVKDQATAAQNGIYQVTNAGSASVAWVLTRTTNNDTAEEIAGSLTTVDSGTTNGGKLFKTTVKATDTVGTTACPWYQVVDSSLMVTSGSTTVGGSVLYNGTTAAAGKFDGGITIPFGTTRLNYGGYFYPSYINLAGSGDTTNAASHYFVETATDGFVRPKTLANVQAEIVTSAAVTTGLGYTPIQQGGGTGQGPNKVYIGWATNVLKLQVDGTDFSNVWPISVSGNATTATKALTLADSVSIDKSSTDLNAVTSTGFFRGQTMTNAPDTGWWYVMSQGHDNSGSGAAGWNIQYATAYGANNTYAAGTLMYRQRLGSSTYTSWKTVLTSDIGYTKTEIDALIIDCGTF